MIVRTLEKNLSALHAWAFLPVPIGTSQELVHSVEHRIFLDPKIAALEDSVVRHNGMTHWTGILLDFTVPSERMEELESALASAFSSPLPKMSFEERERFARELEEGGGDFFDRAIDAFKRAFFEANGFVHSGLDEDAIWESLAFENVRFLGIGNVPERSETWTPGLPENRPTFPVLREELRNEESAEKRNDAPMDYALLFPCALEDTEDFAFHELFFRFLRKKTDEDFRDTGRTYDPIAETYFEEGFAVSGIHLMTSDRKKRLPELPKKPDRTAFESFRDSVAFQISIDQDQLSYGSYPTIGIPPEACLNAVRRFRYDDFYERFQRSCDRVSFFWGQA